MKIENIAIIGNLANVGHKFAYFLNQVGVNSKLILHENQLNYWKQFNPNLDPNSCNTLQIIRNHKLAGKITRKLSEIQILKKYDLIISVALGGLWSLSLTKKPYVSYANGSDLRELAAGLGYRGLQVRQARKVFQNANLVFHSPDTDHVKMLKELGLTKTIPWRQFVDTAFWKPSEKPFKRTQNEGISIFHPANLLWIPKFKGQSLKGNDLLFKGFRLFLDKGGIGKLYYLQRGQNIKETDVLVKNLNLQKHCKAIDGSLNPNQLKSKMEKMDIVVDQFSPYRGFGLISLEAMSMGKPVMVGFSDEMIKLAYSSTSQPPPILQAFTPDEIAKQLQLAQESSYLGKIALASRRWIEKYHDPIKLAEWYLDNIKKYVN